MKRNVKKTMSLGLVIVMLMTILSVNGITVNAASCVKTRAQAVTWLQGQDGAWYDLDNSYGAQCSDFTSAYINYVWHGDPNLHSGSGGFPVKNADTYANASLYPSDWQIIANTPTFLPEPGDIFVSQSGCHTGVVISSTVNDAVIVDQNSRSGYGDSGTTAWVKSIKWQARGNGGAYAADYYIRPAFAPENAVNPPAHQHDFSKFLWYWADHPHYKEYSCSCGEHYVDKNSTTFVASCPLCNPAINAKHQPTIEEGWYKILYAENTKYSLDIANGSTELRANAQLSPFNSSGQQHMFLRYIGDGYYTIMFKHSNYMLDVAGGVAQNRTNVWQYAPNCTASQLWMPIKTGNDAFFLKSAVGDFYLDNVDGKKADGNNVWIFEPNFSNSQKWKFVPEQKKMVFDTAGGSKVAVKASVIANGLNTNREANKMIIYNKTHCPTGTSQYGTEVMVNNNNLVTEIRKGKGDALIPYGGFVISGNEKMKSWLEDNVSVGDYVTYDPVTLQVKVYDDNATYKMNGYKADIGLKLGTLPTTSKEGYTFDGWYTKSIGGEKVTADTIVTETISNTLFAHWKKNGSDVVGDITSPVQSDYTGVKTIAIKKGKTRLIKFKITGYKKASIVKKTGKKHIKVLSKKLTPGIKDYTWVKVKGVKKGTATILATAGKIRKLCYVIVV